MTSLFADTLKQRSCEQMVTRIDRCYAISQLRKRRMVKRTLSSRCNNTFRVGKDALLRFLIGNFFEGRVFVIDYHNK